MNRFFYFFFFFSSLFTLSSCNKQTVLEEEVVSASVGLFDAVQIYLLDYLDTEHEVWEYAYLNEPSGYCLDMTYYNPSANDKNFNLAFFEDSSFLNPKIRGGRGANSLNQETKFLQAHTCYPNIGSVSKYQAFDVSGINNNELKFTFYNACMEAVEIKHTSGMVLNECDKNPKQQFVFENDGKIKLVDEPDLCLTVSYDFRATGGVYQPLYLLRDLSLRVCSPSLSSRQTWGVRSVN